MLGMARGINDVLLNLSAYAYDMRHRLIESSLVAADMLQSEAKKGKGWNGQTTNAEQSITAGAVGLGTYGMDTGYEPLPYNPQWELDFGITPEDYERYRGKTLTGTALAGGNEKISVLLTIMMSYGGNENPLNSGTPGLEETHNRTIARTMEEKAQSIFSILVNTISGSPVTGFTEQGDLPF